MASGVGKWEVVKKGKKQNNSSGGKTQDKKSARKALREANTSRTDSSKTLSNTAETLKHVPRAAHCCLLAIFLHINKEMPSRYALDISFWTSIVIFFEASPRKRHYT